ncbi:MAG: DUF3035 domain-containing protein [Micropepsaceae bacterium]
MTQVKRNLVVAAGLALVLANCTGMKESMGTAKQAPDETAVTARAPLVVPATFALKTPQPGAPRPQDADAATAAQRVLGGAPKATPASQGEMALLSASGAAQADPNVRQELRSETIKQTRRKSYADTVLFWRGHKGDSGEPLDAHEESARISTAGPVTPSTPAQSAPVIEKGPEPAKEPTAEEKQNADKENSGGWFDWF